MSAGDNTVSRRPSWAPRFDVSLVHIRDYAILFATAALFIVLALSSDAFLTTRNLLNIGDQWVPVLFMALGGSMVLIGGGFDLSIGAIFAFCGIASVQMANELGSAELGLLCGVLAGAGWGLANGFLITVLRLNVFVATIGSSIVIGGLTTVITGGTAVFTTEPGFDWISSTDILGIHLSIWAGAVAILLSSILLNRVALGHYIRSVGGNIEAARLSGVRTEWVRVSTFMFSGLGGGLAGALIASKTSSAIGSSFAATQYNVWTALLLGGNSMIGGEGAVWRTVIGVVLLALIGNGFNLLNVDPLYQQIATGGILLSAVTIDMLVRRRSMA